MAVTVGSSQVVKLMDNVLSEREVVVKSDAAVLISKDPAMTAAGADAFPVAANVEESVTLEVGQALYAITASGSAHVSVI